MRELLTYANAIGFLSLMAAAGSIYLALTDNKAAAGTMGALFLVMAIVSQLDSFKSFKAFTVEAQLQDKIDRADELINQLKSLSVLVAKAGYASTGSSLMTLGSTQASGMSLASDFDEMLQRLKVSQADIRSAKQPLIRAIGYRLAVGFISVSSGVLTQKRSDDERSKNMEPSKVLSGGANILQLGMLEIDSGRQLRYTLTSFLPHGLLPDQKAAADKYISELVTIYEECQKAGGPTQSFSTYEADSIAGADPKGIAKGIYEGKLPG
jgi:hypothetical protein